MTINKTTESNITIKSTKNNMKKAKLIHLTPEAIAYWTEIAKANGSTFKTFIQIILEEKPKLKK